MADQYTWTDNPTQSGVALCNTDVLNDCLMHLKYNNKYNNKSGGGLELCDIGTALYVDETKGLRRRLNGSIMDITGNYQAFLTRLKEITTLYPNLVCTETEWQTIKTASKLGQCGKFVYNYDTDGTTINSIRLPLVININGLVDMSNAGLIKDESLPNITGLVRVWDANSSTGVFNGVNDSIYGRAGGNVRDTGVVTFNASRSSSAYQDNAPVQQEAIQYPYFIQIATGQETENNIVNDIELNNPYVLFTSHYVEAPLYNLSWLKSDGEYKPKATYTKAYEALVVEQNTEIAVGTTVDLPSGTKYTKRGLSVKLPTASDITDYDFVINTTDETFRLPLKNGQEGALIKQAPVVGNGNALGVYGTDGTSLVTNYLYEASSGAGIFSEASSSSVPVAGSSVTGSTGQYSNSTFVGVSNSASKSGLVAQLSDATIPTNYNLYYYVGETVQNVNLIDAGRIGENLANKLDTPPRYPVEISDKSLMPSWYIVYNDGWCEQGGHLPQIASNNNDFPVTFLKPYKDANYWLNTSKQIIPDLGTANVVAASFYTRNRTSTGFTTDIDQNIVCEWEAKGYVN